jgi:hypothetical protein
MFILIIVCRFLKKNLKCSQSPHFRLVLDYPYAGLFPNKATTTANKATPSTRAAAMIIAV